MADPTATLQLHFRPTVSRFILATVQGTAREIACFGTRGDGKTVGALGAMVAHAQRHHATGGQLPTKWLGAADTFQSHVSKTHDSLLDPLWKGCWSLREGGHLGVFRVAGQALLELRLVGVEDQAGMDRLRTQCHGLWFEEPAPSSVLVQSSGLSESAWGLALTSLRLPSYRNPAMMTLNYPDEEHWTWQRFAGPERLEGTEYFRIPPGELASPEMRARWAAALANRPDMLRRLIEGRPGTIMLGEQVAAGFNEDVHVAPARLVPDRYAPLWIGVDGGESHTWCSVIGQRVKGRVHVLAALLSDPSGARQHIRETVLPWLGEHAPWALEGQEVRLNVRYDPACDTEDPGDLDSNPLRTMRALLRGAYRPGPVTWPGRLNPLLALFNAMASGAPVLQVDPACRGLIKALSGGWHYATKVAGGLRSDKPAKPNHPHEDFGDSFAYLIAGMAPLAEPIDPRRLQREATTRHDPYGRGLGLTRYAVSSTTRRR